MKKILFILLMMMIMMTAACGKKEENSAPSYPEMDREEAKSTLEVFMWLEGYEGEIPHVKEIREGETEDGRPALVFTMASHDEKKEGKFIVSISKKDFSDYTADVLETNF